MRPSKGGGGNLRHYIWVKSVLHSKKIFCFTNFSGLIIFFASLQMTSSWIQTLDKA